MVYIANIGGILMVNVTIYSIHGSYGIVTIFILDLRDYIRLHITYHYVILYCLLIYII